MRYNIAARVELGDKVRTIVGVYMSSKVYSFDRNKNLHKWATYVFECVEVQE